VDGVQIFGLHCALEQTAPVREQSVPPATQAVPSALHVVSKFPLQPAALGWQKYELQVANVPLDTQ